MNYLIFDKTSNTGRNYIDHNWQNCELEENAMIFKNKSDAEQQIINNCAENWAVVHETELKANY